MIRLLLTDQSTYRIARQVLRDRLTYLDASAIVDLHDSICELEKEEREGIFVEAGCALGGSALVIAASKKSIRPLYIYDVFGMIPPPSEFDGSDVRSRYDVISSGQSQGLGGRKYYGYEEDLFTKVFNTFSVYGLPIKQNETHLIKGLYQDTLIVREPVAFAHLDCDWYESVMVCLQRIEPYLVIGGTVIVDDYQHWSGCKKAVDSYFADKKERFVFVMKSRLHIIRKT